MFSNYEECIKAIDFLLQVDLNEISLEREFAIERSFEIIGGVINDWDSNGLINRKIDSLFDLAINMRHKVSHFYCGLNVPIVREAIKDLDSLKKLIIKKQKKA